MTACSPQRFLANNSNLLRDADLVASAVLGVVNKVLPLSNPRFGVPARQGNATVALTGTYVGAAQADYDIQILDDDVEVPRVSTPTFSGAGSGTLTDIDATGAPQIFILECQSASIEAAAATVSIEGAVIKAAVEGTDGNAIQITVDQSGLVYTDSNYSLVEDVETGQGGTASPLIGQAFDFDAAQLDANGLIPTSAHRIAFAGDPANVYLQYKNYVDGEYKYFTVPALRRDYAKGTRIQFVTGGRTIAVSTTTPPTTETTTAALPGGVVTVYDFLNWIRTQSQLLVVSTPVTNDRSPTGQASREFAARTDAHAEVSRGTGSAYATGFVNVSVAADAATQLVTAECIAVTSGDHPNARLGAELWALKSSILGDLGIIRTGVPFSGSQFGLTIPVKLPPGYGEQKGHFTAEPPIYVQRAAGEEEPPICPVAMTLGPDAVDQTITLTYVQRPAGGCNCVDMPIPNLDPNCVGAPTEGGATVAYRADTNTKLKALRLWKHGIVRQLTTPGSSTVSATEAPAIANPLDGVGAAGYPLASDDGSGAAAVAETIGTSTGETAGYRIIAQGVPQAQRVTPLTAAQYAQATDSLNVVVNKFEQCIARIDPLSESSPDSYREWGMTAWDDAFTELQDDVETAINLESPDARLINLASSRYQAALDHALAAAGLPVVGGADASTVSGDGCWRDWGDSRFWSVESDVLGTLMPLFTNHPYYASVETVGGFVYSIHQFALQLNVKCVDKLKLGDKQVLRIRNSGYGVTYQMGDQLEQPIVAASPLLLTGGVNGAPIQSWTLHGSVSGPFPTYPFNPDNPTPYSETAGGSTVGFQLVEGGIPFAKGDRFRWAVEGGHWRWRKDGGAWNDDSPPLAIPVGAVALDSGLSVTFSAGASASFVADDLFKFRALQPWAVSNVQRPTPAVWKWSDGSPDGATLRSGDLGSTRQIDMFAMVHTLPEGATAVLWGGADPDADDWSEPLTWREDIIWKAMDRSARYLRLELADAAEGAVQFAWAGVPVKTALHGDWQPTLDFRVERASGQQGGRYVGETVSGTMVWSESALAEDDADALIAFLRHVKRNDDEPFIFIPNVDRADAHLVRPADDVTFTDSKGYNQRSQFERRVSASLALEGVIA